MNEKVLDLFPLDQCEEIASEELKVGLDLRVALGRNLKLKMVENN
jgi:hypothetical protein